MEIKKLPAIRFKEFEQEWEEKPLMNITSLITKGTTPLNKSGAGTINFIKIENINTSTGLIEPTSKITEEEHSGYLKRSQLKENDILFSIAGTLGRVAIVNAEILPANTNQALAIIRLKDASHNFVSTFLKGRAITDFVRKNPTVGAQPNLSLLQISNFNVATPQQSEQTQIGNYFKELDGLILLQEQKLEKVKILKKAMLEKMFPNAGADVPEIRFEGFDGKWEKEALGEIATNKSGKYNPKNQVSFVKCVELEYIQSETGRILGFVNGSQLGSIKNVFRENDVLFGKLRPYLKKYCYPDFAGVCSSEIWVLNGKKIINIFLYYLIQTNLFIALANQSSGSKMPRADWNVLQNGLFFYPFSKKEQKKIGVYFQNLDKLISQSQQKIEQLKHLKQALLQKMFI